MGPDREPRQEKREGDTTFQTLSGLNPPVLYSSGNSLTIIKDKEKATAAKENANKFTKKQTMEK